MAAFDPAWDMPAINWQQQGSFEAGELALAYAPDAAPLVCIPPINQYWLPYIQGCLDQLLNPSTWITSSDSALNDALDAALRLKQIVGQAGTCPMYQLQLTAGCVLQYSTDGGVTWNDVAGWDGNFNNCVSAVIIPPIPPNPGHDPTLQHACNISGFLSKEIIQLTVTHAVNGYNTGLTQLQFAQDILDTIAYAFPITAIGLTIFHDLYASITSSTISDFTAASTDPVLWGMVTCAIYDAIKTVGYIDSSNLPAVISNICGMTYTYADVTIALCSFITNVGLQNLQAMQAVGVIDNIDCSGCVASPCIPVMPDTSWITTSQPTLTSSYEFGNRFMILAAGQVCTGIYWYNPGTLGPVNASLWDVATSTLIDQAFIPAFGPGRLFVAFAHGPHALTNGAEYVVSTSFAPSTYWYRGPIASAPADARISYSGIYFDNFAGGYPLSLLSSTELTQTMPAICP